MEDVLDSSLDLVRRLPPKDLKKNLGHLLKIRPEISEDLLQTVDQPLEVGVCPETQKEYLLCDYNRDEDSYRSPHSNEFDPPLPAGSKPSDRLRNLEVIANEVFEVYAKQYALLLFHRHHYLVWERKRAGEGPLGEGRSRLVVWVFSFVHK
jgi:capping protein (actin filament) muscle Z-line, beta